MEGLPALSASKIKMFLSCPHKFYYHYIMKQEDSKSIYAVLGTSFHKAIEDHYRKDTHWYETYQSTWKEELKKLGLADDSILYYTGVEALELFDFTQASPHKSELYFRLPFPNPENPLCIMVGIMDQIYLDPPKVIDFKTAKKKPTKKELDNDLQFIIYSWAYRELFGEEPNVYWYHARTGESIQADVGGGSKLEYAVSAVNRVIEFINNPQLDPVQRTCYFCPFPQLCRGEQVCQVPTLENC